MGTIEMEAMEPSPAKPEVLLEAAGETSAI